AVADADDVFQGDDKDFAVADLAFAAQAAACAFDNGVDSGLDKVLIDGNVQANFADQIDLHGLAAEIFRVALLAAVALNVGDGEAEDFHFGESLFYGFQPVRLNDGNDQFHVISWLYSPYDSSCCYCGRHMTAATHFCPSWAILKRAGRVLGDPARHIKFLHF